ncbi:MAG: hypothetical protein GX055_12210 [Desulfovibrionales bacterium]|nr:hypothetical protein [Desulfovibrionales bacterium]
MAQSITHTPPTSTRSRGFTLVELLVLMVVMTMLIAMSGTALMKYLPRADLKYATGTIVSILQDARMEAIKHGPVAVIFNADGCTLYVDSGDGNWNTVEDNVATKRFSFSEIKRGGVSFSELPEKKVFVFGRRGRINPPSRTIKVKSRATELQIKVLTSGVVKVI